LQDYSWLLAAPPKKHSTLTEITITLSQKNPTEHQKKRKPERSSVHVSLQILQLLQIPSREKKEEDWREKKYICIQQKEYGKHCHIADTMRSDKARRRRRKWRADGRSQRPSSWAMAEKKKESFTRQGIRPVFSSLFYYPLGYSFNQRFKPITIRLNRLPSRDRIRIQRRNWAG
jgi:hypothetical protein